MLLDLLGFMILFALGLAAFVAAVLLLGFLVTVACAVLGFDWAVKTLRKDKGA